VSAVYALPGDVIRVREPIPALDREGLLTPGHYAVIRQFDRRLVLAMAGEDEGGEVIASGEPLVISIEWLETEAIGITYLKATRWVRIGTDTS
jgi:hypothetical protein